MMRGVSTWAVAVRKPTPEQLEAGELDPQEGAKGEIDVVSFPLVSYAKEHRWARLPVLRGVVALVESLKIGFRALNISANAQMPPDDEGEEQEIGGGTWVGTVIFAMAFAIGLFFLLPAGLTSLIDLPNGFVFVLIEKARAAHDLPRLHPADLADEGPAAGVRVPRRRAQDDLLLRGRPRPHARERAALLAPAPALRHQLPADRDGGGDLRVRPARPAPADWLFISRVVGIPLVAGIAFEAIKWFGRNRTKRWARVLMWPGLQLQRLTTREPDLSQLAVAIAAARGGARGGEPGRGHRGGQDRHGSGRLTLD